WNRTHARRRAGRPPAGVRSRRGRRAWRAGSSPAGAKSRRPPPSRLEAPPRALARPGSLSCFRWALILAPVPRRAGGHLPDVAPRILHHASTVAVGSVPDGLERGRAGVERPPDGGIRVFDVHVEERRKRLPLARGAHEQEGVADPDLRRRGGLEPAGRSEDLLE